MGMGEQQQQLETLLPPSSSSSSSSPLDPEEKHLPRRSDEDDMSLIRRMKELSDICNDFSELSSTSESEKVLEECFHDFQSIIQGIPSEFSSLGSEDLDAYLEHAKEELNLVQAENLTVSDKIEVLTRTCMEDSNRLERALEELDYSLKFVESRGLDKLQMDPGIECPISTEIRGSSMNQLECYNFEILELVDQIEKIKVDLSYLQDLDCILGRVEAIGQIEDTLTDLKVIEFEGNCIRLSLKTFIPTMEGLLNQPRMDYGTEPSVVDHELLIEVVDGTLELKKMEIFPSDIFIGDIVDFVKSLRQSSSFSFLGTRSSLEWVVRKVQTRIILCCLRQTQVKDASKSRHSFEYLDKDETIKAHVVGGIYTFIKIPECWPILNSPLKLISFGGNLQYCPLSTSEIHSHILNNSFFFFYWRTKQLEVRISSSLPHHHHRHVTTTTSSSLPHHHHHSCHITNTIATSPSPPPRHQHQCYITLTNTSPPLPRHHHPYHAIITTPPPLPHHQHYCHITITTSTSPLPRFHIITFATS